MTREMKAIVLIYKFITNVCHSNYWT